MIGSVNKKLEDFHNIAVLFSRESQQHLTVAQGRLEVCDALPSSKKAREVEALVTSLLSRVEAGVGPLTHENVKTFVFEKIFPLHPTLCNPSAMQKNPMLRAVIAKRVEELEPEIAKDPNLIECRERIKKIEQETWHILRHFYHPGRVLKHYLVGSERAIALENELKVLKWQKSQEERYAAALTEAFLGLKMNLSHKTGAENKGWSGSYFWRSYLDNRIIGVYKPSDKDALSPGSPHLIARLRCGLIPDSNNILVSQSGKSHIAEAGARIAADLFHSAYMAMKADGIRAPFQEEDPLVPDTRIVEMHFSSGATEQGIGSFQLYLQNCLPLTEAFGIKKNTYEALKSSPDVAKFLPQYQWLKLLHFLIFAQDDHADNTLATMSSRGEIEALKAIDNGNSFPAYPLEDAFIEKRLFSMKPLHGLKHPLAKKTILPFFREFLRRFSSDGYFEKLVAELRACYQNPRYYPEGKPEDLAITENRIRLLRERFSVLEELFVSQKEPMESLLKYRKGDGYG